VPPVLGEHPGGHPADARRAAGSGHHCSAAARQA